MNEMPRETDDYSAAAGGPQAALVAQDTAGQTAPSRDCWREGIIGSDWHKISAAIEAVSGAFPRVVPVDWLVSKWAAHSGNAPLSGCRLNRSMQHRC